MALRPGMRRLLSRLTQYHVLFPAIAALVVAVIWATTVNLAEVEMENAERAAATSTLELLDTYEAQILRNLREMDQTLRFVKFAFETARDPGVLEDLRQRALLPPSLLFTVAIVDLNGVVLASTRPLEPGERPGHEQLRAAALSDALWISQPRRLGTGDKWQLELGRRIGGPGSAGLVTLSVDAAYFVSGYEREKLGEAGVLALVGTDDDVVRVRRTGNVVTSGEVLAPSSTALTPDQPRVARGPSPWDGVPRFMATRPLYDFSLALMVGLSEDEQLAAARASVSAYRWRAATATALVLLFMGLLAYVSWRLAEAARRENEAHLAHAERVQYLAYHDGLTGLPNRALFSKMLEQGISHARRYERSLALLFLDLDRFKQINDTLGHAAGDELLKEVARRLQACLRDSDTVARLGGDEFVVILPEFEDEMYVATVARKLLAVVAEAFAHQQQDLVVTTSVGIALYPRDGDDEQALMKSADTAMYQAKGEGKNTFQFYARSSQESSLRRLALESALRHALERNELELQYQPQVSLATGAIVGAEALLRWTSPDHGRVSPLEFIGIAEDTGLIVPIGRWVLETACAQNSEWQRQGLQPITIGVNLSARQFADANLLGDITGTLEHTGLEPRYLELEITESLLMTHVERAIRTLSELTAMGVHLAIDDFGTGYSSLSNLKRFPVTTLKIDRAFISDLPHDNEGRAITEAIIGMGKALSMTVVAEGVETSEQIAFLREKTCHEYQGYCFSPPVSAARMMELLRAEVLAA